MRSCSHINEARSPKPNITPAATSSMTSTVCMEANRGLRITTASEAIPTINGKTTSLHVGRRFGIFFYSSVSAQTPVPDPFPCYAPPRRLCVCRFVRRIRRYRNMAIRGSWQLHLCSNWNQVLSCVNCMEYFEKKITGRRCGAPTRSRCPVRSMRA